MESVPQVSRIWVSTLARLWQKRADPSVGVGIARFRFLATDMVTLETALRRAVTSARTGMTNLQTQQPVPE